MNTSRNITSEEKKEIQVGTEELTRRLITFNIVGITLLNKNEENNIIKGNKNCNLRRTTEKETRHCKRKQQNKSCDVNYAVFTELTNTKKQHDNQNRKSLQ